MRITGGTHRSRALAAPGGTKTRPTSDRVREALFGILGARGEISGARVLDLYAGSGALALEALSRGADQATLVDGWRDAITTCRANVSALGFDTHVVVIASTVERAEAAIVARGPFDLVFADPPYADVDAAVKALAALAAASAFSPEATIVLEHASRDTPAIAAPLTCFDRRKYGDTSLAFLTIAEVQAAIDSPS